LAPGLRPPQGPEFTIDGKNTRRVAAALLWFNHDGGPQPTLKLCGLEMYGSMPLSRKGPLKALGRPSFLWKACLSIKQPLTAYRDDSDPIHPQVQSRLRALAGA
jgi:hypothetical protein